MFITVTVTEERNKISLVKTWTTKSFANSDGKAKHEKQTPELDVFDF